jgi:hypothetical protein
VPCVNGRVIDRDELTDGVLDVMSAFRRRVRSTESWMMASAADCGSGRQRSSPVLTLGQLLIVYQDDHGLTRRAHHHDDESVPRVHATVAILVSAPFGNEGGFAS